MDKDGDTLYRVYDINGNVVLPDGVPAFSNGDPFGEDNRYGSGLISAYGANNSQLSYAFLSGKGILSSPCPEANRSTADLRPRCPEKL